MASEMVFLRDEAMVPGHGHGLGVIAHNCENMGRRGGQFTAGGALVAELAATRDTRQVPCREPHGYARGITKGLCKLSYLQLCRRINAPETVAFHGSLRVGGHASRSGGAAARPWPARRRRRRGARGMTTAHRGGMAAASASPCREPGPGAAAGAAFLPADNRSTGRPEKWRHEARRRDGHKPAGRGGTRTGRAVDAVLTDGHTDDDVTFGPAGGALRGSGALQGGTGSPRRSTATARTRLQVRHVPQQAVQGGHVPRPGRAGHRERHHGRRVPRTPRVRRGSRQGAHCRVDARRDAHVRHRCRAVCAARLCRAVAVRVSAALREFAARRGGASRSQ